LFEKRLFFPSLENILEFHGDQKIVMDRVKAKYSTLKLFFKLGMCYVTLKVKEI